jgi:hypothetical protein
MGRTNMKKALIAAALAAGLVLGTAGSAVAGETTGAALRGKGGPKGAPTAQGASHASSECAFSGLDTPDADEGNPPGFDDDALMLHGTQSYGQFIANGFGYIVEGSGPGVACRGNLPAPLPEG